MRFPPFVARRVRRDISSTGEEALWIGGFGIEAVAEAEPEVLVAT